MTTIQKRNQKYRYRIWQQFKSLNHRAAVGVAKAASRKGMISSKQQGSILDLGPIMGEPGPEMEHETQWRMRNTNNNKPRRSEN
jgi:hypothetical protein